MNRAGLTAQWHEARMRRIERIIRIRCPYCGARAGQVCRSKSGQAIYAIGQIHDARLVPDLKARVADRSRQDK